MRLWLRPVCDEQAIRWSGGWSSVDGHIYEGYVKASGMFYFAYGTNLDIEQMTARCPTARPLGPAQLRGWRLTFGPSGWPTIRREPMEVLHGLLWMVDQRAMQTLDEYEDVEGELYRRLSVDIHKPSGETVAAEVYAETDAREGAPRAGLVAELIAAARLAGLTDALPALERLRKEWEHEPPGAP